MEPKKPRGCNACLFKTTFINKQNPDQSLEICMADVADEMNDDIYGAEEGVILLSEVSGFIASHECLFFVAKQEATCQSIPS